MDTIRISLPNDTGSADAERDAIAECYEGDAAAAVADDMRACLDTIAIIARVAGLRYVRDTDHGAEWEGTAEQIAAARARLPAWAYVS